MTMNFKRRLPIPMEIREEMPLSADMAARKPAFDAEVAAIIRGESPRRLLVIGPCSADREDSVLDYVTRLAKLADEVKDKLLVVPRVYTNKPRTRGTGYKGLLHNPDPEAPADLLEGVKAIRRMHLRVVEETGMFTADEMLYPANFQYLIDLLAYVAVGARSVENQEHRLVASGVPMPVGMKNPTGGSTAVLLNSIYAAQAPQTFIFRNWEVERTRCFAATWDRMVRRIPTTTTSTSSAWPTGMIPRSSTIQPWSSTATTTTPASARASRRASWTRYSTPYGAPSASRASSAASWWSPISLTATSPLAAVCTGSPSQTPALAGRARNDWCATWPSAFRRVRRRAACRRKPPFDAFCNIDGLPATNYRRKALFCEFCNSIGSPATMRCPTAFSKPQPRLKLLSSVAFPPCGLGHFGSLKTFASVAFKARVLPWNSR